MAETVKHIQFKTDPDTYKALRIMCATRGWTLQTLLSRMVEYHIKDLYKKEEG